MQNLLNKLHAVAGEVDYVVKNGHNDFQDYDYATEKDFLDTIRPLLEKQGIVVTASCDECNSSERTWLNAKGEQKTEMLTKVMMRFKVWDRESGEAVEAVFPGHGQDVGDKGVYKAMTGATKYFVAKFFLIATGDDPEKEKAPKKTAGHTTKEFVLSNPSSSNKKFICCDCGKEYTPKAGTEAYSKKCFPCFKANGKDPLPRAQVAVDPNEPPFPG